MYNVKKYFLDLSFILLSLAFWNGSEWKKINYLSTVIIVLQDKQVFWPDRLRSKYHLKRLEPSRKSKIPKPNYLFVREVYNEGR